MAAPRPATVKSFKPLNFHAELWLRIFRAFLVNPESLSSFLLMPL